MIEDTEALTFTGRRAGNGALLVEVDGQPLPPRFDVRKHSPDGFECAYGGSGPAQLALAILCRVVGTETAEHYYQAYKWAVVARLPRDGWTLTGSDVVAWLLTEMEREAAAKIGEGLPR